MWLLTCTLVDAVSASSRLDFLRELVASSSGPASCEMCSSPACVCETVSAECHVTKLCFCHENKRHFFFSPVSQEGYVTAYSILGSLVGIVMNIKLPSCVNCG